MSIRVLVIGTGKMGMAHLTVLKDLKPEAIGAWAPSSRSKSDVNKLGIIFLDQKRLAYHRAFLRKRV